MKAFLLYFAATLATWLPATADSLQTTDGQTIHYQKYGTGDDTLIFVHGWMCDQSFWDAQIGDFSKDHTVITLDLPGHGVSSKTRTDWTIEAYGQDIAGLVKALKLQKVVLIGHSMGGPVVVHAAKLLPEHAVAVVGVDTLKTPNKMLPATEAAGYALQIQENYTPMVQHMVKGGYFHATAPMALVDAVTDKMAAGPPAIAAALVSSLYQFDQASGLRAISDIPLILINSDARAIDQTGLEALHPNVRIFQLSGVGHFLMLENPLNFNAILRTELLRVTGKATF